MYYIRINIFFHNLVLILDL